MPSYTNNRNNPVESGLYIGFVKDVTDAKRAGRLRVWIPEFAGREDDPNAWITCRYCSPYGGATNWRDISNSEFDNTNLTQQSYGFWAVPPDINNEVLVVFPNKDIGRALWIGSVFKEYMNHMVPGIAPSDKNKHLVSGEKKNLPVAEYNKYDRQSGDTAKPLDPVRAWHRPRTESIGNQGLINDNVRGLPNSSSQRESPSAVYGMNTPGPKNPDNEKSRLGGNSFIMDDGNNSEYIGFRTRSGAQIKIDETNGLIYAINKKGTAWIQMDEAGNVDIFSAESISARSRKDINFRADRDVNIEAGQNINIKAAMDTEPGDEDTVQKREEQKYPSRNSFPETGIPDIIYVDTSTGRDYIWCSDRYADLANRRGDGTGPSTKYVGEGNGVGGNIKVQALNNHHTTVHENQYTTVLNGDKNLDVQTGSRFEYIKTDDNLTVDGSKFETIANEYSIENTTFNINTDDYSLTVANATTIESSTLDVNLSGVGTLSMSGIDLTAGPISMDTAGTINAVTYIGTTVSASGAIGGGSITTSGGSDLDNVNSTLDSHEHQYIDSVSGTGPVQKETLSHDAAPSGSAPSPADASPGSPAAPTAANTASAVTSAEIKNVLSKKDILETFPTTTITANGGRNIEIPDWWFRDAITVDTIVERLMTYEPCPEHLNKGEC